MGRSHIFGWLLCFLFLQGCTSASAPTEAPDATTGPPDAHSSDVETRWELENPPPSPECAVDSDCPADPDNACVEPGCDPKTSNCFLRSLDEEALCDDGDLCTSNSHCANGTCVAGTPLSCDDTDPCNGVESCDPATGACKAHEVPTCGDGILHTACGEACDDGNISLQDGCDDTCQEEPVLCETDFFCDDGEDCTLDTCQPFSGCSYLPWESPCNDGDACTLDDICAEGSCLSGAPLLCADDWPCTEDLCETEVGCVATPDDNLCEDYNPCTLGLCDPDNGCEHTALSNGTLCEEESLCFEASSCLDGICTPGAPIDCDDGDPCTEDVCKAESGCTQLKLDGQACDDGDPCTEEDQCTQGICEGGDAIPLEVCYGGVSLLCSLVGSKGTESSCFLQLVQSSTSEEVVTALQFALSFDATKIALINFFDWICFNENACFHLAVSGPTAMPLSSGHSLTMAPLTAEGWQAQICENPEDCPENETCVSGLCPNTGGFGAVLMAHLSNPTIPLTSAFLDAEGDIIGDPSIVEIRFNHLTDEEEDISIFIEDPLGSDSVFATVYLQNTDGILETIPSP